MKLLFVANRVPYPPFRGDKLKIWNLAKRLSGAHELHLVTIAESREDLSYKTELEKVFHSVDIVFLPKWKSFLNTILGLFGTRPLQVAYFESKKFEKLLDEKLKSNSFDAIHVQHLRMAGFFEQRDTKHTVLDLPDAFSLYWRRRNENAKSLWSKVFTAIECKRLRKYEKRILSHFPLNLVCSKEDKEYLADLTHANIDVLPNGVDTELFKPRKDQPFENNRILFTGNMDYAPNVDAVEYFCKDIFPDILKNVPAAKLIIAGQRPLPRVLELASGNVEITGFVPNLADEYAKAHLVIAPLRFGAGTQNKVLEALAMEVPVVCTSVGFKGLGINSGEGAILAENASYFGAEVIKLLADIDYRNKIANAGGNAINNKFSWAAVAKQLEAYFIQIKDNTE